MHDNVELPPPGLEGPFALPDGHGNAAVLPDRTGEGFSDERALAVSKAFAVVQIQAAAAIRPIQIQRAGRRLIGALNQLLTRYYASASDEHREFVEAWRDLKRMDRSLALILERDEVAA